jgi:hypothetical protein
VGPVHHVLGDQFRIGNDDVNVVVGDDGSASGANSDDVAFHVADGDPVANGHRPLKENDETTDKIVGDILKTKTDA